ncbi:hypothetical protein C8J46_101285 [Sphingomonas sp. PP-F2F-A104-K0414]|nr:hypothetical protein C8J46_101285 [Sphingomonas sp. PP-F2F-A104-K0414]
MRTSVRDSYDAGAQADAVVKQDAGKLARDRDAYAARHR